MAELRVLTAEHRSLHPTWLPACSPSAKALRVHSPLPTPSAPVNNRPFRWEGEPVSCTKPEASGEPVPGLCLPVWG